MVTRLGRLFNNARQTATMRLLEFTSSASSTAYELAKDIGQDASVQVIVDFDWSIYPKGNWSLHGSAARSVNNQRKVLTRTYAAIHSSQVICFSPVQPKRLCIDA